MDNYNAEENNILFEAYLSLETLVSPYAKAQQVMRYASYLDPDFIPIFFFESLLDISKEELEEMVELLGELALINLLLDQEGKKVGIRIHQNIQETCKSYPDWVDKRTEQEIVISILEFLSKHMPDVTSVLDSVGELAGVYAPHAAHILAEGIALYHPSLVELLHKMSAYSQELANPEQARKYHEMAIIIDSKRSSKSIDLPRQKTGISNKNIIGKKELGFLPSGWSPLHYAAWSGDVEDVKELIQGSRIAHS